VLGNDASESFTDGLQGVIPANRPPVNLGRKQPTVGPECFRERVTFGAEGTEVGRMRGVSGDFDGAIDVSRQNSAANPTVGTGRLDGLATSLYPYPTVQYLGAMYADRLGFVFEAPACCQVVVMLVNRRGDDALALEITDESARQYICFAGRVEIVRGVDCVGDAEDGDLPAFDQGTDPGTGHYVIQLANSCPTLAHATASARSRRSARVAGRI
jgi:hypothetical protein